MTAGLPVDVLLEGWRKVEISTPTPETARKPDLHNPRSERNGGTHYESLVAEGGGDLHPSTPAPPQQRCRHCSRPVERILAGVDQWPTYCSLVCRHVRQLIEWCARQGIGPNDIWIEPPAKDLR